MVKDTQPGQLVQMRTYLLQIDKDGEMSYSIIPTVTKQQADVSLLQLQGHI